MNVFRIRGEQIRVNGMRLPTTLSEIEANRGFCRCHKCSLPIERAEKHAAACNDRLAERDFIGHAVRTRSSRIPCRNLRDRRRDLLQLAVDHAVLNIYVLGPVNRGDKRDVLRLQSAYLHEAHRMP